MWVEIISRLLNESNGLAHVFIFLELINPAPSEGMPLAKGGMPTKYVEFVLQ